MSDPKDQPESSVPRNPTDPFGTIGRDFKLEDAAETGDSIHQRPETGDKVDAADVLSHVPSTPETELFETIDTFDSLLDDPSNPGEHHHVESTPGSSSALGLYPAAGESPPAFLPSATPPPVGKARQPVPAATPRPPQRSGAPVILAGLVLGLGAFGGAYTYADRQARLDEEAKKAAPAATSTSPSAVATPPPQTTPAIDAMAMASDLSNLRDGFGDLKNQVDSLRKGLAEQPKPEPAPAVDFAPITTRIDELAKKVEGVSAPDGKTLEEGIAKLNADNGELATKIEAQAGQLASLEKQLAASSAAISTLEAKFGELSVTKPNSIPATASGTPAPVSNLDADLSKAIELFKANQFPQALAALAKLQTATPDDARVWYYSALANGFASGQWAGETVKLVERGIEREKAGTPDAAKITASFSDLAPPTAKAWLDAYRGRAR